MIVAIIQARMKSTRLPGKALKDIDGRPMILHVIERALAIRGVDRVALNVPLDDMSHFDNLILRPRLSVHGVQNQEQDVLGSFLTVAEREEADVIVRVTGDCPLLCPTIAGNVVELYKKMARGNLQNELIYCANDTLKSGYPDGTDVEVFSMLALRNAARYTCESMARQHVTTYIRQTYPNYGVMSPLGWWPEVAPLKLSVDEEKDLEFVRRIYRRLEAAELNINETAACAYLVLKEMETLCSDMQSPSPTSTEDSK